MTVAAQSSAVEQKESIARIAQPYQQSQQLQQQISNLGLGYYMAEGGSLGQTLTIGNTIQGAQSYNMANLTSTKGK